MFKYSPNLRRQYHSDKEDKKPYHIAISAVGLAVTGIGAYAAFQKLSPKSQTLRTVGEFIKAQREHMVNEFMGVTPIRPGVVAFDVNTIAQPRYATLEQMRRAKDFTRNTNINYGIRQAAADRGIVDIKDKLAVTLRDISQRTGTTFTMADIENSVAEETGSLLFQSSPNIPIAAAQAKRADLTYGVWKKMNANMEAIARARGGIDVTGVTKAINGIRLNDVELQQILAFGAGGRRALEGAALDSKRTLNKEALHKIALQTSPATADFEELKRVGVGAYKKTFKLNDVIADYNTRLATTSSVGGVQMQFAQNRSFDSAYRRAVSNLERLAANRDIKGWSQHNVVIGDQRYIRFALEVADGVTYHDVPVISGSGIEYFKTNPLSPRKYSDKYINVGMNSKGVVEITHPTIQYMDAFAAATHKVGDRWEPGAIKKVDVHRSMSDYMGAITRDLNSQIDQRKDNVKLELKRIIQWQPFLKHCKTTSAQDRLKDAIDEALQFTESRLKGETYVVIDTETRLYDAAGNNYKKIASGPVTSYGLTKYDANGKVIDHLFIATKDFAGMSELEARKTMGMSLSEAQRIVGPHVQSEAQLGAAAAKFIGNSNLVYKYAQSDINSLESAMTGKLKGKRFDLEKLLTMLRENPAKALAPYAQQVDEGMLERAKQTANKILNKTYSTSVFNVTEHNALVDSIIEGELHEHAAKQLLRGTLDIDTSRMVLGDLPELYAKLRDPKFTEYLIHNSVPAAYRKYGAMTSTNLKKTGHIVMGRGAMPAMSEHQVDLNNMIFIKNPAAQGIKVIRDTSTRMEAKALSREAVKRIGHSGMEAGNRFRAQTAITFGGQFSTQGATAVDYRRAEALYSGKAWSVNVSLNDNTELARILAKESGDFGNMTSETKERILAQIRKMGSTPDHPINDNIMFATGKSIFSTTPNSVNVEVISPTAFADASWINTVSGYKGTNHIMANEMFDAMEARGFARPLTITPANWAKNLLPYNLREAGLSEIVELSGLQEGSHPGLKALKRSLGRNVNELRKFAGGATTAEAGMPMQQTMMAIINDIKKAKTMRGLVYTHQEIANASLTTAGRSLVDYWEGVAGSKELGGALAPKVGEGAMFFVDKRGGMTMSQFIEGATRGEPAYQEVFTELDIFRDGKKGIRLGSSFISLMQGRGVPMPETMKWLKLRLGQSPLQREASILSALGKSKSLDKYSDFIQRSIQGTTGIDAYDATKHLNALDAVMRLPEHATGRIGKIQGVLDAMRAEGDGKLGYTTVAGPNGPMYAPIVGEHLINVDNVNVPNTSAQYKSLAALRAGNQGIIDKSEFEKLSKSYVESLQPLITNDKGMTAMYPGIRGRTMLAQGLGPGGSQFHFEIGYKGKRAYEALGYDFSSGFAMKDGVLAHQLVGRDPQLGAMSATFSVGKHAEGLGFTDTLMAILNKDLDKDTSHALEYGTSLDTAANKRLAKEWATLNAQHNVDYHRAFSYFKGVQNDAMTVAEFMGAAPNNPMFRPPSGRMEQVPMGERSPGVMFMADPVTGEKLERSFKPGSLGAYTGLGSWTKAATDITKLRNLRMGKYEVDALTKEVASQTGIGMYYRAAEGLVKRAEAYLPHNLINLDQANDIYTTLASYEDAIKTIKSGGGGAGSAAAALQSVGTKQYGKYRPIARQLMESIGSNPDTLDIMHNLERKYMKGAPRRASQEVIDFALQRSMNEANEEIAQQAGANAGTSAMRALGQLNMPKSVMIGMGVLAAAYFFKPNQMGVLGEMPGTGGEANDYRGGRAELPFLAPVDIPEYTWDVNSKVSGSGIVSRMQEYVGGMIPRERQRITADTSHLRAKPGNMTYNDKRRRMESWNKGSVWRDAGSFR